MAIGTKEIVQAIVDDGSINATKKLIGEVVGKFYDVVMELLEEHDDIRLGNLGALKVKTKDAHVGRNPKTGESVQVASKVVVSFKASKTIKDFLNK